MEKKQINKPRTKAKNQKLVSRAVKQAGFKNIKEAKETLARAKKGMLIPTAQAPESPEAQVEEHSMMHFVASLENPYIRREVEELLTEGAPESYIRERAAYLSWKIKKNEPKASCGNKCGCRVSYGPSETELNFIRRIAQELNALNTLGSVIRAI